MPEVRSAYTRPARNSNVSPFLGTAKAPRILLIAIVNDIELPQRGTKSDLRMQECPCGPLRGIWRRRKVQGYRRWVGDMAFQMTGRIRVELKRHPQRPRLWKKRGEWAQLRESGEDEVEVD